MTEINEQDVHLSPTMRDVVLHWGEMGQSWGVNRSVGQIHALLYLIGRPLSAQDIAETLGLARLNVSTSLKELLDWGMIARRHELGDRRDFFIAKGDIWDIFMTTVEGRKQREFDPTVELLARAAEAVKSDPDTPADVRKRIQEMHRFTADLVHWYDQVKALPRGVLINLMKLGARIGKFAGS